jgi:predicted O-linked N-acetylglucosamine transferase (SPINDLY family)
LIRQDKIDILIDLTAHMANNRLLVFARKPAPVQATWLAYPSTTGLDAIDYRITDPYLDPPGMDQTLYSEASIRLPDCYWLFNPMNDAAEVNLLPANFSEVVTFGSLNPFCKINDEVLGLWARVLQAVPKSKLLVLARQGRQRQHVVEVMGRTGIAAERIRFEDRRPRSQYLELHHQLDIVLDPFPWNGHTTSLDALWMGVPVVTLTGNKAITRGGLSLLSNLNLSELAANSHEDYVRIATELAGDVSRLSELRTSLRSRMQGSPLMDAARFTRNMENVFAEMWMSQPVL